MDSKTIDREAGDKSKGFRLQPIRAIKLMLDTIQENPKTFFFTAVENVEDVSHQTLDQGKISSYYEEEKNYNLNGKFTLFSPPVLNTLVSFFDIYAGQFGSSEGLSLGFYSTREIGKEQAKKVENGEVGKEREKKTKEGDTLFLPDCPLLDLLKLPLEMSDYHVDLVKNILLREYASQYSNKEVKGNLGLLESQKTENFRSFLGCIKWFFGQEDDTSLKRTVLSAIESSSLFNSSHLGKTEHIFSLLMERLGENLDSPNLVEKLVTAADIKLIFKDVESCPVNEVLDPSWQSMKALEQEVLDKRNVKEKVLSVIDDFPISQINNFARKATNSKYEEQGTDKSFLSLKYRIYDLCDDYFLSSDYCTPEVRSDLDEVVRKLVDNSMVDISKLEMDYKYTVSNEKVVEGIVWNLFDSCFIAFDEYEDE